MLDAIKSKPVWCFFTTGQIEPVRGGLGGLSRGLQFYPRAGQIFVADFSDLQAPEITKKRPVIVFAKRLAFYSDVNESLGLIGTT